MDISTQSPSGGVFITEISATSSGTVANKVYQDGIVLTSCEGDTTNVRVAVLAMTGSTHLIPRVTVNDFPINNFSLNAQSRWYGSVAITGVDSEIIASHEDGGVFISTYIPATGPVITSFNFTGGYPSTQTELKLNDVYNLAWTSDKLVTSIEVVDFEAAQSKTVAVSGTSGTFSVSIANRGSGTFSNQRCKIRCQGSNGIWGNYFTTDTFGSGNGSAYVQLNNDTPVISAITQGNITYPASQSALKDSETATVNHTITVNSGAFTASYVSSNGELTPSNNSTYEAAKVVTRLAGTYNIASTNLTITATKTTNLAVATRNVVVYIAHTAHTIAITQPNARLRSSAAGSDYTITITGSQRLLDAPSLSDLTSGQGTWQGAGFAGSGTTWTRTMRVLDSDSKGTFSYSGLTSTNLAGKVVNTILSGGSYVLGGFTSRTIAMSAWPNRELDIGTTVSNTAKLTCLNNSKGASYSITFVANTTDAVDKFSITTPTTVYNASGHLLYNNDLNNAVSNVSGLATFTIEELV